MSLENEFGNNRQLSPEEIKNEEIKKLTQDLDAYQENLRFIKSNLNRNPEVESKTTLEEKQKETEEKIAEIEKSLEELRNK